MNSTFPGAMPRLDAGAWTRELGEFTRRLMSSASRIVGWGTGSVFDYFQRHHPLPLAYLVDNDASRWGQRRGDLTIVGPNQLETEDPSKILVIVYSGAWPEIVRQVASMGFTQVVPASAFFAVMGDEGARARMATADELAARETTRSPKTGNAIVVQGPVLGDMTPYALKVTSALHPHDHIILSTWDNTPEDLLAQVAPFVDEVVLSPMPDVRGIQNRNCQIVSTRAGLSRARALGATTVFKSRTDLAVVKRDLFQNAAAMREKYPALAAGRVGLRDRLIVPASYTRKYLLYHAADLVMLGHIDDLMQYWSAPLDPRTGDVHDMPRNGRPLREVNLDGNPTESYFGLHYCQRIGRPVVGDLADSWSFYRDLFIVVDNDWFELLWFKNLAIPDLTERGGPRQLVDHEFWRRLATQDSTADLEQDVDVGRVTFAEFAALAR